MIEQKVQNKLNLPNLVLSPLYFQPMVKHYSCKLLKYAVRATFSKGTHPIFLLCERSLRDAR